MRQTWMALLAGGLFVSPASAQTATRQDSLDAAYRTARLTELKSANGVGQRRNLADSAIGRERSQLARLSSQPARVDTVVRHDTTIVHDTTVVHDTVYVPTQPPPVGELPQPLPPIVVDTGRFDGPAELPRSVVDLTYPPGSRRQLRVSGSIQLAIDTAKAGDDVIIPAGTYVGNLTLRGCAAGWIVIRGEGLMTPVGTRMTPTRAATVPKLVTAAATPVIRAEDGACGYRVVGVSIGAVAALPLTYSLVTFGDGDEATLSAVPRRLILDRVVVQGSATLDVRRGVYLNCAECGVVDSWISDIRSAFDAAAVWSLVGPGPMVMQNNHLEASGENVMLGGGQLRIPGVLPADVTIRGNYFVKPASGQFKNLLEMKAATRVLVEGNVLQAPPALGTQPCDGIVLTATDQDGGTPWATVSDITIRGNHLRGTHCALNLMGYPSFVDVRMSVRDNLIDALASGNRVAIMYQHNVQRVAFRRNTFLGADYGLQILGTVPLASIQGLVWSDNLLSVWTSVHTTTGLGEAAIAPYAVSPTISGNVYVTPGSTLPSSPGVDRAALAAKLAGVVVSP